MTKPIANKEIKALIEAAIESGSDLLALREGQLFTPVIAIKDKGPLDLQLGYLSQVSRLPSIFPSISESGVDSAGEASGHFPTFSSLSKKAQVQLPKVPLEMVHATPSLKVAPATLDTASSGKITVQDSTFTASDVGTMALPPILRMDGRDDTNESWDLSGYDSEYRFDIDVKLGNDFVIGGQQNDTIRGGGGNDTLAGSDGADWILGGDGYDTVDYSLETEGYRSFVGGIYLNLSDRAMAVSWNGASVTLQRGQIVDRYGNIDAIEILDVEAVIGTERNDVLRADNGPTGLYFDAREGNDQIQGSSQNDTYIGGLGRDTIWGGGGNDLIIGSKINANDFAPDDLWGAEGNDTIYGGSEDSVRGGQGDDTIYGGKVFYDYSLYEDQYAWNINLKNGRAVRADNQDTDTLNYVNYVTGSKNGDTITGTDGSDTLYGGAGYDDFYGTEGSDLIDGGADGSGIYYTTLTSGGINLSLVTNVVTKANGQQDTLANVWHAFGTQFNDNLTGAAGTNILVGGAGRDQISGAAGDDVLYGGTDDDMLQGGLDQDTLYGESGADNLYGEDGSDTLYGGSEGDSLFGGNGADKLYGEDGNDTLDGGDDASNDLLDGGAGWDVIIGSRGNDVIDGGADGAEVDYSRLSGPITLKLDNTGPGTVQKPNGEVDTLFANIWHARGTNFNDVMEGDNSLGGNVLYGNGGNDELRGMDGNDWLYGGSGKDTLKGGNHSDHLFGDDDDDVLDGGSGADTMEGGSGNDTYYVDSRADSTIEYNGTGGGTDTAWISVKNYDARKLANIENWGFIGEGSVNKVADAPTITLGGAVNEDGIPAAAVGYIKSTDDGNGGALTYHLVDDYGGLFRITTGGTGMNTFGVIELTRAVDFESIRQGVTPGVIEENGRKYYILKAYAAESDTINGGLVSDKYGDIRIEIVNVNEKPNSPHWKLSSGSSDVVQVPENQGFSYLVFATDPDGPAPTYAFAKDANGNDLNANGLFQIDAQTGLVTLAAGRKIDFESSGGVYKISVIASDGQAVSDPQELTISVADVDEAPSAPAAAQGTAVENTSGFSLKVSGAVDPEGQAVSYAFDTIAGSDAGGLFQIASDGTITIASPQGLDYEASNSWIQGQIGGERYYILKVVAKDPLNHTSTATDIKIVVTNVNERPTDITLSATEIAENSVGGTPVGVLGAVDPDGTGPVKYQVLGDPSGKFEAVQVNGVWMLRLKQGAYVNFEEASSHTIKIRVWDNNGGPGALSYDKDFTITVKDDGLAQGNEPNVGPVNLRLNGGLEARIDENATFTGTLTAYDQNGDSIAYTFQGGGTTSGAFSIQGNQLKIVEGLNYETAEDLGNGLKGYHITVVASDGRGSSTEQVFTFVVNDVNEAPILNVVEPTEMDETLPGGSFVAEMFATDPEGDDISFTFDGGSLISNDGLFEIRGSKIFRTNQAHQVDPGDEDRAYSVIVSDTHGANSTSTVIIHINNVNAAPEVSIIGNVIREDTGSGQWAGTLSATDPDLGDTVDEFFLDDDCGGLFELQNLNGTWGVVINGVIDYENDPRLHEGQDDQGNVIKWYEIKVSAQDNHGLRSEPQTLKIIIEDVNPDNTAPEIRVAPNGTTHWEIGDTDTVAVLRDISFFDAEDGAANAPILAGIDLDDPTSGVLIVPPASQFPGLEIFWDPMNPYAVGALGAQDLVTAFLKLVQFDPLNRPGETGVVRTSNFQVYVYDSQNAYSSKTVIVDATATGASVNNAPPVIQVDPAHTSTPTTDWALNPVKPFEFVTLSDTNADDTLTVTVSFNRLDGTISGAGQDGVVSGNTITYTFSGNQAAVNEWLENLTFDATNRDAPGQDITTRFTITVNDGHHGLPVTNTDVTVVTTVTGPQVPDAAPTINDIATAVTADANNGTVAPFADMTVANDAGQQTTMVIRFADANGELGVVAGSGINLTKEMDGTDATYTFWGTAAELNAILGNLTFDPRSMEASEGPLDTVFTVIVTDINNTTPDANQTGTVTVHATVSVPEGNSAAVIDSIVAAGDAVAGDPTNPDEANKIVVRKDLAAGLVAKVTAHDGDAGDTLSYSLESTFNGLFTIDVSGQIIIVNAGNLPTATTDYVLTVKVFDGHQYTTQNVTVRVAAVTVPEGNSAAVIDSIVPAGDGYAGSADNQAESGKIVVRKDLALGTVAKVNAHDVDADDALAYSLESTFGGLFAIDANSQISIANDSLLPADATDYVLEVRVFDGHQYTTQNVTVRVVIPQVPEGNTAAVIDSIVAAGDAVAGDPTNPDEATKIVVRKDLAGGLVAKVTAHDGDAGDTLSYSLESTFGGIFVIDANTGQISIADSSLLPAATSDYVLEVRVFDGHQYTTQNVTVRVAAVTVPEGNSAAVIDSIVAAGDAVTGSPDNPDEATKIVVRKDLAAGLVAQVTAHDADASDTLSYSLAPESTFGDLFTIDSNGRILIVNAGNLPAATTDYALEVRVFDGHQYTTQNVTVRVAAVTVPEGNSASVIDGIAAAGDAELVSNKIVVDKALAEGPVAQVSAHDADAGDTLSYSLSPESTFSGLFSIDSNGQISIVNADNLPAGSSEYVLEVRVYDGHQYTTQNVTVGVADQSVSNHVPSAPTLTQNFFFEGDGEGSLIANIQAADEDGDQLEYWIVNSLGQLVKDDGRFKIVGGELQVSNPLMFDSEVNPLAEIKLVATDGRGGVSDQITHAISVLDWIGETIVGDAGDNQILAYTGNDNLSGGTGNDTLSGGIGRDILKGDEGSDVFLFDTAAATNNTDIIVDFKASEGDKIYLKWDIFRLGSTNVGHALSEAQFYLGSPTAGITGSTRIIYEKTATAARLWYDGDGSGSRFTPKLIATFSTEKPDLQITDFLIV